MFDRSSREANRAMSAPAAPVERFCRRSRVVAISKGAMALPIVAVVPFWRRTRQDDGLSATPGAILHTRSCGSGRRRHPSSIAPAAQRPANLEGLEAEHIRDPLARRPPARWPRSTGERESIAAAPRPSRRLLLASGQRPRRRPHSRAPLNTPRRPPQRRRGVPLRPAVGRGAAGPAGHGQREPRRAHVRISARPPPPPNPHTSPRPLRRTTSTTPRRRGAAPSTRTRARG